MRRSFARLAAVCIPAALSVTSSTACSGGGHEESSSEPDATGDEVQGLPSGELGGEAGPPSDAEPPPPQTNLRIAHLSPDLPPMDVCVAPHGSTSWMGPLIGQLSGVEGGAPGLTYAEVSAYLSVSPGPVDVRIVPAGSTSCETASTTGEGGAGDDAGGDDGQAPAADAGDDADDAGSFDAGVPSEWGTPGVLTTVTTLPPLVAGGSATLLIAGEVSPRGTDPGLTFAVVQDDTELAGGAASLRTVNALPQGDPIDVGLGSSATKWTALFTDVAFAAIGTQAGPSNGAPDRNGYLPIPSLSDQTMSVRASTDTDGDLAVARAVTLPFGSIATLVAIGAASDAARPGALLLCVDNQPSGGILSDCSVVP
jgi:hypothetical protein